MVWWPKGTFVFYGTVHSLLINVVKFPFADDTVYSICLNVRTLYPCHLEFWISFYTIWDHLLLWYFQPNYYLYPHLADSRGTGIILLCLGHHTFLLDVRSLSLEHEANRTLEHPWKDQNAICDILKYVHNGFALTELFGKTSQGGGQYSEVNQTKSSTRHQICSRIAHALLSTTLLFFVCTILEFEAWKPVIVMWRVRSHL